MWFGTRDGLNRFDGYDIKVYEHDPDNPNSLSGNHIWEIYEEPASDRGKKRYLWIATLGGLNRFDRESEIFTHYRHDLDDPGGLSHNNVLTVYKDSMGVIWIGTGGGLNRLDPETETFTHYIYDSQNQNSISHNIVSSILEDPNSSQQGKRIFWIGTVGGLNKFEPESEVFTRYRFESDDPVSSRRSNVIRTIYQDEWGKLWIGTYGGLLKFDPETETFTNWQWISGDRNSLSDNTVFSIYQDKNGTFWIGTESGG